MKQYYVFAGEDSSKGMEDFKNSFDKRNEAWDFATTFDTPWKQVWDSKNAQIVFEEKDGQISAQRNDGSIISITKTLEMTNCSINTILKALMKKVQQMTQTV